MIFRFEILVLPSHQLFMAATAVCYHSEWYCHSCSQVNVPTAVICKRCGRSEDYVEDGYEYALLGNGSEVFRPSHAKKLITDIHETDENNWTVLHNACYLGVSVYMHEVILLS